MCAFQPAEARVAMEGLSIRRYQPGDELHILGLFETVFHRSMSPRFWQWRFHDNPAGQGEILLAWDGEILAGHYAAIPVDLVVDGLPTSALLSMTTMTHPEYTGRGIFTGLAARLYAEAASNGFRMVFGFPNENSRHGFSTKLGWSDLGMMSVVQGEVPRRNPDDTEVVIASEGALPEDLDSIRVAWPTEPTVRLARSSQYLRWRFEAHPDRPYQILSARHKPGALAGIAILKTYEGGEEPVGHIVDLLAESATTTRALVIGAMRHFDVEDTRHTASWFPAGSETERVLLDLGLRREPTQTAFGYRALSEGTTRDLSMSDWWITMGDSDVY